MLPSIGEKTNMLKKGSILGEIESFINCKCPKCGDHAKREIDTLDTFVDSSWYFLRFLEIIEVANSVNEVPCLVDLEKIKHWMPVDIYVGGMEHAIMHLLYARFVHKFLSDANAIAKENPFNPLREPFKELIVQGLVKGKTYRLKESGRYLNSDELYRYAESEYEMSFEKMSKSKGNGIFPEEFTGKYGVDTLRIALMFAAPPESDVNFDENFIQSMKQFLDRVERLSHNLKSIPSVASKSSIQE